MQRERVALVLDNDAGAGFRDGGESPLHVGVERRQIAALRVAAGLHPHLGAMAADAGSSSGEKMRSSSLIGRPLTNATAPPVRSYSRASVSRSVRHEHLARGWSEIEDRSVDVEQDGKLAEIGRKRWNDIRHDLVRQKGYARR